jgi:hypothetical protein
MIIRVIPETIRDDLQAAIAQTEAGDDIFVPAGTLLTPVDKPSDYRLIDGQFRLCFAAVWENKGIWLPVELAHFAPEESSFDKLDWLTPEEGAQLSERLGKPVTASGIGQAIRRGLLGARKMSDKPKAGWVFLRGDFLIWLNDPLNATGRKPQIERPDADVLHVLRFLAAHPYHQIVMEPDEDELQWALSKTGCPWRESISAEVADILVNDKLLAMQQGHWHLTEQSEKIMQYLGAALSFTIYVAPTIAKIVVDRVKGLPSIQGRSRQNLADSLARDILCYVTHQTWANRHSQAFIPTIAKLISDRGTSEISAIVVLDWLRQQGCDPREISFNRWLSS